MNSDYRDGSRLALERLIRIVVDETGGGLGGLGESGGSSTMSSGAGRPRTPGGLVLNSESAFGAARHRFGGAGDGGPAPPRARAARFGRKSHGGEVNPASRGEQREHSVEVSYASWVQAVGEGAAGKP